MTEIKKSQVAEIPPRYVLFICCSGEIKYVPVEALHK